MRVLLADDHAILRETLRLLLELEPDMEVIAEADNGREAVDLTNELHPDVILMDVSMPVMDGIQATRAIHAAHPDVCVIGLSMHNHLDEAMRKAGAFGYVSKSGPADQLVVTMRTCYAQLRGQWPPAAAA